MELEVDVVRRSSSIQGTEESRGFRLDLRELSGFRLRLREQGVSGAPGCERWSSAFQAETVGAGRLQAGMEGAQRSRLRRRTIASPGRD